MKTPIIGGPPQKVFIGIPTNDGWVHAGLLTFITALGTLSPRRKWMFRLTNHIRPIAFARNTIVGDFLDTDADALWFIDADQSPYESAVRMLDTPGDIVSGFTVGAQKPQPSDPGRIAISWNVRPTDEEEEFGVELSPDDMKGTRDIAVAGTGCLLIRRSVLTDDRLLLAPREAGSPPAVFRTQYLPNGQVTHGEDYDFCRRARALGYSVKVNMDARFGHHHTIDLLELIGKGRGTDPGPEVSLIRAV